MPLIPACGSSITHLDVPQEAMTAKQWTLSVAIDMSVDMRRRMRDSFGPVPEIQVGMQPHAISSRREIPQVNGEIPD